VEPGFEDKLFIPYNRLSKTATRVHGEALAVDPAARTVRVRTDAGGAEVAVPYDLLVIATGCTYPFPSKPAADDSATAKAQLVGVAAAIRAASVITVVGGGPTGIETAGELKNDFPDKAVHLVHSGATLISGEANRFVSPVLRERVLANLRGLGVQVHLNARVALPAADALPAGVTSPTPGVLIGKLPLTVTGGPAIESQVTLRATGGTPNNAAFRVGLASAVDSKGFLRMGRFLQVEGFPNIFALGDIAGTPETKSAGLSGRMQAPAVAKNVIAAARALGAGRTIDTAALTPYMLQSKGMMFVLTGRRGGVGQFGNSIFGNWTLATVKGGNMMVGMSTGNLGYSKPGVFPDAPPLAAAAAVPVKAAGGAGAAGAASTAAVA
jgi:apoptosis-inducing factor 2